ncbi:PAS domain S-box protein [Geothermobacter ehrlichii]|nr:PAS domain S-box protein [Geothermobacter ehrlichii]
MKIALSASVLALLAGIFLYGRTEIEREMTRLLSQETLNVNLGSSVLARNLESISRDLSFLSTYSALKNALDDPSSKSLQLLANDFANFSRSKGIYDQIRWLDETGMEIVRVDYAEGKAVVVPTSKLQSKGKRYYFTGTFKLQPGEVFVSPLDLNIEQGKVEVPFKPMLRVATPVTDSQGAKRGIVILNYYGRNMLDAFAEATSHIADHIMLVNGEGYWLKSPNPADEWGFMFKKPELSLAVRNPEAWEKISASDNGQIQMSDGLWTWQTVYPLLAGQKSSTGAADSFAQSRGEIENKKYVWKSVAHLPREALTTVRQAIWLKLGGVAVVLLSLLGLGSRELAKIWAAMRADAELHNIMMKAIGDGVIATDVRGRVKLLNPVAEALTGWTDAEARGKQVEEVFRLVHEETGEKAEDLIAKVLRDGHLMLGLATNTLLIAKDGVERPIAASAIPIRNVQGDITSVVLVFRNQSEKRQAEEAQRLLAETIRASLNEIYIFAADTLRFLFINDAALRNLGYTMAQMLEMTPLDLKPTFTRETFEELIAPLRRHELQRLVFETEYRRVDGSMYPVEVHLQLIESAGPPVFRALVTDITERKRAEAERERLIAAIEHVGEIIFITDLAGTIQYVNPAFEAITGYTREEVLGQTPRILKSGEHGQSFYRDLWGTITSGKTWQGRIVDKRKDGTLFTVDATISPVKDRSGQIVSYVAVKRDITEYLQVATQLQQAQKMESVGRLAGGVAHDFNNMLSVILGCAEIAMGRVDPTRPLFPILLEIRKAAERSADITRQLLGFARRQMVEPKVLDLNKTVEGTLKILRRLIGENIDLVWLPDSGVGQVKMDPAQINQILANLCVNAQDAIADTGKITIETRNVTFDNDYCARHTGSIPGKYVLLAVSDNGCGMDKETLANIFEPFFTTKETGQGTGLGLATVYGIVKQNNGFINVYSEPGHGTTFKIYLPRYQGEARLPRQDGHGVTAPCGQETILLVEDEPAILDATKTMLEQQGYTVLPASSPGEALRLAEAHSGEIHLLMTDVIMPEMNGRDLARNLTALYPNLKSLFMSGYTANVIAHHGVLNENVNFIPKPFGMQALCVKVREVLDRK